MRGVKIVLAGISLLLAGLIQITTAQAALNVEAEMNPNTVGWGQVIRTEVTVTNDGNSTVADVELRIEVPPEIEAFNETLVSNLDDCTGVSNNGRCDAAETMFFDVVTLGPGEGFTVSFPMTVAGQPSNGTEIDIQPNVLVNNVSQANTSQAVIVKDTGTLHLELNESQDPIAKGKELRYTLAYGNSNLNKITSTTLTFPLPAGTTFQKATGGGTHDSGTVTWNIGDLPGNSSGQETVILSVGTGMNAGTILQVDSAELSGTNIITTNTESAKAVALTRVVNLVASAPLALAIEANPNAVALNEWIQTEVTVSNRGNATLSNVEIVLRTPVENVYPNASSGAATNESLSTGLSDCVGVSNNGRCDPKEFAIYPIGTLAAGQGTSVSIPMRARGDIAAGNLIQFDAVATADGANPSAASFTVPTHIGSALRLAVNEDRDPVALDENADFSTARMTYTLTYGNTGLNKLTDVVIRVPLPEGMTNGTDKAARCPGNSSQTDNGSGFAFYCTIGDLEGGASGRIEWPLRFNGNASAGSLIVLANAEITGTRITDSGKEFARASAVTRVVGAQQGLAAAIQSNYQPQAVGDDARAITRYTVSNRGSAALSNVQLIARTPERLSTLAPLFNESYVTGIDDCVGVSNNGRCDPLERILFSIGNLGGGESRTLSIPPVILGALADGEMIQFDAQVSADNVSPADISHTLAADDDNPLQLTIIDKQDTVAPGTTAEYILVYSNTSLQTFNTLFLQMPIPDGMTFQSASGEGSFCCGNLVSWSIPNLEGGRAGFRTVSLSVDGGLSAGSLLRIKDAELKGTNAATNLKEGVRATEVTRVVASAPLTLALKPQAPNQPGDVMEVQATITNSAAFSLADVVVTLTTPDKVDLFSETLTNNGNDQPVDDCVGGSNDGRCGAMERAVFTIGTMTAGQSRTVTMPPPVSAGLSTGEVITMWAEASNTTVNYQATDAAVVLIGPDADADYDALPDAWEIQFGLNPNNPADATQNADADSLTNFQEWQKGTNPNDADTDNDTYNDDIDAFPLDNGEWLDTDGDRTGNNADTDDDNDEVLDGDDNCRLVVNPDQENFDGDSVGDACDSDDDNDGVPDGEDNFPLGFVDVAETFWGFSWIETLAINGITVGCGNGNFCPFRNVTRAEMAVFLLRSQSGSAYTPPPATGEVFNDVPATFWGAPWIEELAGRGITGGCGGGNYCSNRNVTRAEMAVFLLRGVSGAEYVPPAATGTVFIDVSATFWGAPWIEELARRGITGGCGNGNYCSNRQVNRAEMAVFLVRGFELTNDP